MTTYNLTAFSGVTGRSVRRAPGLALEVEARVGIRGAVQPITTHSGRTFGQALRDDLVRRIPGLAVVARVGMRGAVQPMVTKSKHRSETAIYNSPLDSRAKV